MLCANNEEALSEWRAGMMIPFYCKTLWRVEKKFFEVEKLVFKLNYFFKSGSFFNAEGSTHNSANSVATILGKEGADACLTFKVDTLLDAEGLVEVN